MYSVSPQAPRARRAFTMLRLFTSLLLLAITSQTGLGSTLVQFRTPLGNMEIELFNQDKPVTVANFVQYAQSGRYKNVFVHRWVPGFVIQGGGFRTVNRGGTNYLEPVPTLDVIPNEYRAGKLYSNQYGTLAMARVGGQTNSATSQWFFNLGDNGGLDAVDGGFTVFGRVLRGTNVLNRFNNVSRTNGIYRVALQPPFEDLPVLANPATLSDLVFSEVRLLTVEARISPRGERVLSWTGIEGRPNHLEATTDLRGPWVRIHTATGTGQMIEFIDSSRFSRFYRVRIDFD